MKTNLIKIRKQFNLTQLQTAEKIGISETSYQRIEYGTRNGSIQTWQKLAEIFNTTIDHLIK